MSEPGARMVGVRRAAGAAIVVVALGQALLGCTRSGEVVRPYATYERGPVPADRYEGPAATLGGVLLLEDGCLYLADGSTRWLPAFPEDANWDESAKSLAMDPFGGSVRVGEQVELIGGAGLADNVDVPEACRVPGGDRGPDDTRMWLVGSLNPPPG